MRELVDYNPMFGRYTYVEDGDQDEFTIREVFDRRLSKAVVDRNKALEGTQRTDGDMRLTASIPPEVQLEWVEKFGVNLWNPNHAEGVKRLLNDPDYRYLRINHIIL